MHDSHGTPHCSTGCKGCQWSTTQAMAKLMCYGCVDGHRGALPEQDGQQCTVSRLTLAAQPRPLEFHLPRYIVGMKEAGWTLMLST
eukprot:4070959-Amphidinium_carterae.1